MRALAISLGVVLLAASARPAAAARLVVPFAISKAVDGKLYRTRLLFGNRGNLPRAASARFVPANGPAGQGVQTVSRMLVPPRGFPDGQVIVESAVPADGVGMLEITGAPQVSAAAVVEVVEGGEVVAAAHVPVIDAGDAVAVRAFVPLHTLLDLDVDTGFVGFVDLGSTAAQPICGLDLFKPDGGLVGKGTLLAPGTVQIFDLRDFFALRGADPVTGFGEVQCTFSPAYVYIVVFRGGDPALTFATPSPLLGAGR